MRFGSSYYPAVTAIRRSRFETISSPWICLGNRTILLAPLRELILRRSNIEIILIWDANWELNSLPSSGESQEENLGARNS